jgi:tetratricopeptide (TPR) repeat protein
MADVGIEYLIDYCGHLQEEFLEQGDLDRLHRAVRYGRVAVAEVALQDPVRPGALTNLGGALALLFEVTGDLALIDEAIACESEAVRLSPESSAKHSMYAFNLGTAFMRKYRATKEISLLESATALFQETVNTEDPADSLRAAHLSDLGGALRYLYYETGHTKHVKEAVRVQREAAALTPNGPTRVSLLNNLSGSLNDLWSRTGRFELLEESVELLRTVVAETPEEAPTRAQRVNNMVVGLQRLYDQTDEIAILEEAIPLARESLRLTPREHSGYARRTSDLAQLLVAAHQNAPQFTDLQAMRSPDPVRDAVRQLIRIGWMQDPALLWEAVELAKQAVALTPEGDPDFPIRLYHLAEALTAASGDQPPATDVDAILRLFQKAVDHPLTYTTHRVSALGKLARIATRFGRAEIAIKAITNALDLLEPLAPRDLDPQDREHRLSSFAEMPAIGATAAISVGQLNLALDLLERTRGITAREFMSRRTGEVGPQRSGGPFVILTASALRCDALVVTAARDISLIPLPKVTEKELRSRTLRFRTASSAVTDRQVSPDGRTAAHQEMMDVLSWLWDVVAEPVLSRLGLTRPLGAGQPWPHVTWCPVGLFSLLPIHAAGRRDGASKQTSGQSVLDCVVSSYTTTLAACAHSRSRGFDGPGPQPRRTMLIVAAPDAAIGVLPGTQDEANELKELLPFAEVLHQPKRAEVLEQLPETAIVHFACHAIAHPVDPSLSHLELGDGDESQVSISAVRDLNLRGSLAYLSACQASMSSHGLLDEGIHIAGAFQLAGYRHVVGTLWPIDDRIAVDMAADFYNGLISGGAGGSVLEHIDVSGVAISLHHATRRLRERYPQIPFIWAAFTHWGPED